MGRKKKEVIPATTAETPAEEKCILLEGSTEPVLDTVDPRILELERLVALLDQRLTALETGHVEDKEMQGYVCHQWD
jgi:hypothetical protein